MKKVLLVLVLAFALAPTAMASDLCLRRVTEPLLAHTGCAAAADRRRGDDHGPHGTTVQECGRSSTTPNSWPWRPGSTPARMMGKLTYLAARTMPSCLYQFPNVNADGFAGGKVARRRQHDHQRRRLVRLHLV